MRVLIVGGSGLVGSFITPYLRERHELRVLDVRAPSHDVEWIEGSATDTAVLRRGLDGVDAFVNVMMRSPQGSGELDQTEKQIRENYETNTLALHLLLFTAKELGVMRGVHTSTMSVHSGLRNWYPAEELVPFDTPTVYGFTKALGEQICEYFARWFGMSIAALRITGPCTREQYLAERRNPTVHPKRLHGEHYLPERRELPADATETFHLHVTDEEDMARAFLSALELVTVGSRGRFDAFFISGDERQERHNLSKAMRMLGWQPESQRLLEDDASQ